MNLSIRARLTLWYSSIVVVVLVTAAFAGIVVQSRLALERLDADVARTMATLEGVMRTEINEGLTLQASADEASSEVVAPDRTLGLARVNGEKLAVWGLPLESPWRPTSTSALPATVMIGSGSFRSLTHVVNYRGHDYVAAVLAPLVEIEAQRAEMIRSVTIGLFTALLAAVVGGWVIGRQTLRPLADMAQQAGRINEQTPSARLNTRSTSDELSQLATAFNGLLDRLAAALNGQRQFMADASHEMRTPVSVVRTAAQVTLSREDRSDEEYREALQIVSEQAVRLSRLVDSMFLLSRAEAQGIPLRREPLYLDDVVGESVRALQVLANARGVTITTDGDTDVAFTGDSALLRQMVANLLDNAVRHARQNGAVGASLCRSADAIVLRVTDDGAGVPEADRERVFQRFVRVSASEGAGLGLPIARRIAEAHGGRLSLESSGPPRTCFTLHLPAA